MKGQKTLFSSKSDEWATPQAFFDKLNAIYNFTLDPCASFSNHKCEKYYSIGDDGLSHDWTGEVVFCNPPYSNIRAWVEKSITYIGKTIPTTIVMLIPARTDTFWFHSYIWSEAKGMPYTGIEVNFIRGRLKFGDNLNSAPFPSMLVVFK